MSKTSRHVTRGIGLSLILLICAHASIAMLTNIKLEELVAGSTLIAYGRTETKNAKQSPAVEFQVITLLRAPSQATKKTFRICNDVTDVESYDLSRVTRTYLVFAAAKGDCFAPIHGLRSVVQVRDQVALTGNISEQPSEQPLNSLLSKVRSLSDTQSSK